MKHERATEEVRQRSSLYALSLLTQNEARSFELHLEECTVCRTELGKIEHAAAKIGLATEETAPPLHLRERLLAILPSPPSLSSIAAEPVIADKAESASVARPEAETQTEFTPADEDTASFRSQSETEAPYEIESSNSDSAQPEEQEKSELEPETASPDAPAVTAPLFAQSVSTERSHANMFVWILVIVFVLLSVFALYSWQIAKEENQRLQSRITESENNFTDLKNELAQQQATVSELEKIPNMAEKPDTRIARLRGEPAALGSTGVILWDVNAKECTLTGSFTPPEPENDYQLWLSAVAGRTSIGIVNVSKEGRVFATFTAPPLPREAVNIIVSIEPKGGSTTLTGAFAAVGRLEY